MYWLRFLVFLVGFLQAAVDQELGAAEGADATAQAQGELGDGRIVGGGMYVRLWCEG